MNRAVWTEERETQLRELRDRGYSSSQIAAELGGVTRNAVIGAAHRMGLRSTKRVAAPKAVRKPRVRSTQFRKPVMKTEPLPMMDRQSDAPVTLFDLEPHHCRWPSGDAAPYTFCGGTKLDGSSYCGHHHRVAYRP